jgi:hypothetical protein
MKRAPAMALAWHDAVRTVPHHHRFRHVAVRPMYRSLRVRNVIPACEYRQPHQRPRYSTAWPIG